MCLYITMIGVARFGVRAVPATVAMAMASLVVPVAIPSWHDSLAKAFDNVAPLAIPVVGIVTYAVVQVCAKRTSPSPRPAQRSVGWQLTTSARASPATCTTCLDTPSRRSR